VQKALLTYALGVQAVTFLAWGYDKWRASGGRTRVRERTLLLLALAGGAVGAWAGVRVFRHKSAKPAFLWKLALVSPSVLLLAWAWWRLRPSG